MALYTQNKNLVEVWYISGRNEQRFTSFYIPRQANETKEIMMLTASNKFKEMRNHPGIDILRVTRVAINKEFYEFEGW